MLNVRHFVRSFLVLGLSQIFSWVGAIALTLAMPRYLGDGNLGRFGFVFACVALVGLLADLGTGTYLAKEVARHPESVGVLTINALILRLPLVLVSATLAISFVYLSGSDSLTRQIVYIVCVGMLLTTLGNVISAALQGLHQMKRLALMSLISNLGYAVLGCAALFTGRGALGLSAAWSVSAGLGLVAGAVSLLTHVRLRFHVDRRVWRRLLAGGLPFIIWQGALTIYGQIDIVLLSLLVGPSVVGWYVATYRIIGIPIFVPTMVMTIVFPALAATADTPHRYNAIARQAIRAVTVLSVPMAIGLIILPDKVLHFLRYPDAFQRASIPIALMAPTIAIGSIDVIIATVLNTRDRQMHWAMTGVAAAILNPMMNFVAIPYTQATFGNGAIGAAAVTTITELFMFTVALRLLPRGVLDRTCIVDAARCLAAGLVMAVAVWLTRDMALPAVILLGGAVYGICCMGLGVISVGDFQRVRGSLLERTVVAAS